MQMDKAYFFKKIQILSLFSSDFVFTHRKESVKINLYVNRQLRLPRITSSHTYQGGNINGRNKETRRFA